MNSTPSSGCRVSFPLVAATARGCRSGVALQPALPLSRVCPRRRGGSPSNDLSAPPALSLRRWGLEVLIRPPSAGRMREVYFPSLVAPVADEDGFTSVSLMTSSAWFKRFMPADFRSKDVARGFTGNPQFHSPSRYVIDWGVVSHSVTHQNFGPRNAALRSNSIRATIHWLTTYRRL